MVSRRTTTTGSRKKSNHKLIIPHSKNGRCMSLGCIGVLNCAGQPDVGRGWGEQWQVSWWLYLSHLGHIWCTFHQHINVSKGAQVAIIAGCQGPNDVLALSLASSCLSVPSLLAFPLSQPCPISYKGPPPHLWPSHCPPLSLSLSNLLSLSMVPFQIFSPLPLADVD